MHQERKWQLRQQEEAQQRALQQQQETQRLQQLHIDNQPNEMEGVFEYLPSRTMTEEERARHRTPKRKERVTTDTTDSVASAAVPAVEQNDVLMLGREEVWAVQPLPPEGEDEL